MYVHVYRTRLYGRAEARREVTQMSLIEDVYMKQMISLIVVSDWVMLLGWAISFSDPQSLCCNI